MHFYGQKIFHKRFCLFQKIFANFFFVQKSPHSKLTHRQNFLKKRQKYPKHNRSSSQPTQTPTPPNNHQIHLTMSSYWERLWKQRSAAGQCFACGSSDHWTQSCIYKYACYVCQGTGHKSFDCPVARQKLREEAKASAPVHYTASHFLQQTTTQSTAYASLPKAPAAPLLDYEPGYRADRDYSCYQWGKDPDAFRQPIYVIGLPTFELLPVFNRLLPSDFAPSGVVNKARRDAFVIMRAGIQKLLQDFAYHDQAAVQQIVPAREEKKDDGSVVQIPATTQTVIYNPLSIAAREDNKDAARALLHYATFAEETTQLIDIVAYNKKQVDVQRDRNNYDRYQIELQGIGEGRPSVLRGDRVLLSPGPGLPIQGGMVHFVNADTITFAMPPSYDHTKYPKMDLVFILPRSQERSYHRALSSNTNWFLTERLCLANTSQLAPHLHTVLEKKKQAFAVSPQQDEHGDYIQNPFLFIDDTNTQQQKESHDAQQQQQHTMSQNK